MRKVAAGIIGTCVVLLGWARAEATAAEELGKPEGGGEPVEAARITRDARILPLTLSPRVGDDLVTGHVWGGYDGGARTTIGEAVVEGKLTPFLVLRVGGSSSDLWGRRTAILGVRAGILRQETAPFDLGVGLAYQPQSIRGDGLVTATVSFGKRLGRVSSFASLGYGQDPEGDDYLGTASLGAVVDLSRRVRLGLDSRVRYLKSNDQKFVAIAEPTMDFCAGPLLAYSIGAVDVMAQGGIAGLRLDAPKSSVGERATLQLGPLFLLSVGAAL